MARRPRLFGPGLLYHVIARGNQRQQTFFDEADYGAYLRHLALYRERHGVSLHAYCLMPNHVHLLVRTGDTPLAKFMQGVQQSYTLRFNRIYKKVGHLFQGRYQAIVCDSDLYLLTLVRYIHLNPVRATLTATPEEYPYSGHRTYLAGRSTALIDPTPVLDLVGGPVAYARFVSDGQNEGHRADLYPAVRPPVLGNPAFPVDLAKRVGPSVTGTPREPIAEAAARLLARLGLDLSTARGPDRGWRLASARAAVALVLTRRLAYRPTEVAGVLGRDPVTLGKAVTRLAARAQHDPAVARQVRELEDCPESKV
jgi:REP element-mobilizing transposase RayT